MSVERRCSRPPEGRADMKNSLRKVHRRASTSGIRAARRRLVDRSGPRSHVGPPAASQRVQDGHTGRFSSYLRKHVGEYGHNRAPRAGTRRRRQTPLKVSLRAIVRQGSSACTHRDSIRIVRELPEHGAALARSWSNGGTGLRRASPSCGRTRTRDFRQALSPKSDREKINKSGNNYLAVWQCLYML